ncbi:hypothetical protein CCAL6883_02560 [Campylobacter sp. RM6883]|uniref:zonular occludens toxin domain-containing protein n=1 Tax=Campylobacter californiensis TaxID=1032243 RepID=UPI0014524346|nr:zonular occludens toxin domain-containing protein [Campylobacter sp. RM6914]MBE2984233.1 hypothetical protein [Campylobacter sp. RM6883]MBE2994900.1 hypothetical protein [Campylobacter sp. RM6913]QCD50834.1 zonula occludens toxin (Zot) family protein [Campylobacter sp. RM6914]
MLSIIIGPPRSGKTYKAVDIINEEYELHLKNTSKYRYIYTNINGLKFELFNGFVKQYNKIDFISATQQENALSSQYENGFLSDIDDYDSYALKSGIYENYHHCLIILDEVYNTFSNTFSKSLGRFLSYHGHFGIDVIFLLQSKRQMNREYLVHTELMYIAQPSGKRLFSTIFRYKVYSTSLKINDNLIRTDNLKFNQKISDLYNSGSKQIYKSYATKKILFLIIFIIFSYMLYLFLEPKQEALKPTIKQEIRFFDANISESIQIQSTPNNQDINDINTTIFNENKIYLKITCFPSGCKFRSYAIDLSLDSFLELLSFSNCHIFLQDKKSVNYIDYFLSCPLDFERVLKGLENSSQGVHNENFAKSSPSSMFSTFK